MEKSMEVHESILYLRRCRGERLWVTIVRCTGHNDGAVTSFMMLDLWWRRPHGGRCDRKRTLVRTLTWMMNPWVQICVVNWELLVELAALVVKYENKRVNSRGRQGNHDINFDAFTILMSDLWYELNKDVDGRCIASTVEAPNLNKLGDNYGSSSAL